MGLIGGIIAERHLSGTLLGASRKVRGVNQSLMWANVGRGNTVATNSGRGTALYAVSRLGSKFDPLSGSPGIVGGAHIKRQGRTELPLSGRKIQDRVPDFCASESVPHSQ